MSDRTLELSPFALHATLWAPLEAQRAEGPVLLCRDCLMSWHVILPEADQPYWHVQLDQISKHAEAHEGQPIP